jgi:hypothetical protein
MMVSLCSETRKTRTRPNRISLKALLDLSEDEYQFFNCQFRSKYPRLQPEHLISYLFSKQNDSDFAKTFDTLRQDFDRKC